MVARRGVALILCVELAACMPTEPIYTPFSRSWNPNFAKRTCSRTHRVHLHHTRRGAGDGGYSVCDEVPVPNFRVVRTHPLSGGEYLVGADMRRASLSEARLANANLSGADLEEADLTDANLYRARLPNADLQQADLMGADLTDADLAGANLRGANLMAADFEGAILTQADVRDVTWSTTRCPDGTVSDQNGGTCLGHLGTRSTDMATRRPGP